MTAACRSASAGKAIPFPARRELFARRMNSASGTVFTCPSARPTTRRPSGYGAGV